MEKVIKNYLTMETSYALLINGPRGIGKTFFIKDSIIPKVSTIPVFHDQNTNYKPVYISLYGIKSIDDVYTLLAIEFMPWLKNKSVKVGLSIGKLIVRGLLNVKGASDLDKYVKDLSGTTKNAIDTKDFVLIFDDLDRISASLEIGEVVGFINSLVEHENNKVIIVADEDQFRDNNNYIAVKEKTIGTIIEYASTVSLNYDAIIKSKYQPTYKEYYDYLIILKEDILHFFQITETKNLRILIYFLQHFHEIFSRIYTDLKLQDYDPESLSFRKLYDVMKFAVAVSIEFKKGKLSFQRPNGIDDMIAINQLLHNAFLKNMFADNLSNQQNPADRAPIKSYKEIFLDTYYKDHTYNFYPSIYNFISGGDSIDEKELLLQLKHNFDDKIYKPTPQDAVYQQLSDPEVLNLSNDEYIKLTDEMFGFAVKGAYPLDRYLSILYYLERYPEIKQYDISAASAKLIKGIKANQRKFQHDDALRDKFGIEKTRENYTHFLELFKALNEVNNGLRTEQIESNRAGLFKEFKDTPDMFYQKANELNDVPFLAHWNFVEFLSYFKTMPTSEIPRFNRFLRGRFEHVLIKEKLEYFFIESLFNEVQKAHDRNPITLREVVLKKLGTVLQDIIARNAAFKNK